MKAIFMGTPDIAIPSLEAMIEEGLEVVGVFTQPDRPKGRGKKLAFSAVKERALELGLEVFQPKRIREEEIVESIRNMNPDIIVVTAFGQILPKEILEIPNFGCINVHASLLPKLRGAAPINWCIINGDKKTGITTMYMDEGLDTGDMILKEEIEINANYTAADLYEEMKPLSKKILKDTIRLIKDGSAPRTPQDNDMATYAPIMNKELGFVDWSKDSESVVNLTKGVYSWPGAYTKYMGNTMKLKDVVIHSNKNISDPATIIDVSKEGMEVQTGDGTVMVKMIQMPGKKMIKVEDYIRGNTIEKGIQLGK